MNSRLFIILACTFLISCNKQENTDTRIPFNSETDCNHTAEFMCSDDFVQINYCIDASLCYSDGRLTPAEDIKIMVETAPRRIGRNYDTLVLDGQKIFFGSFCVPAIPNQDSLILGLWMDNTSAAIYEKIEVSPGAITTFEKEITEDAIWNKPPCEFYTTLERTPDLDVDITAGNCIVGSPGDCYEFSTPNTIEEFNLQVEGLVQEWEEFYDANPYNTPCGEIYVYFD